MNNPFLTIYQKLELIENQLQNLNQKILSTVTDTTVTNADNEQVFNTAELANYLRCSTQTIHNLKKQGHLPYHKLSRLLYFKKSEVDNAAKINIRGSKMNERSNYTFSNN